jgi:hypothetical protein
MAVTASYLLRAWREPRTGTTRLRIVHIDDEAELVLVDGLFLIRVLSEAGTAVHRYCIRHVASGREAYVQGGKDFDAFLVEYLRPAGDSAG